MSNSKTFDPKEIFGNAFAEAEAPDGYIVTDSLEVIPEVNWEAQVKVVYASVGKTAKGFPKVTIGFEEVGVESAPRLFDNFSTSASMMGNQVTARRLISAGANPELVKSGDLEKIAESFMGIVSNVRCTSHDEGTLDGRLFPQYSWISEDDIDS